MLIILNIISVSNYRSKRKKERKIRLSCLDRRKNRPAYDKYAYAQFDKKKKKKKKMKSEADCR